MISRRQTLTIAKELAKVMLKDYTPVIEIRFTKNTQKRVLKEGFRKLVPGRHSSPMDYSLSPRIVLHVRHGWRRLPVHRLIGFIAHELGHAHQILSGHLSQDKKGVVTYLEQDYWFFYNVHYRQWLLCPAGSYKAIRRAPWEVALQMLGTMGEFMETQVKWERKLYGYAMVDKIVPTVA